MFQSSSSSSSSSLFLDPYNFRTIKKIKKRDAEKWNVLECEVVRKKMKEGNKEKKLRVHVWRRKKEGKKRKKKEICIKNKIK